MGMVSVVLRPEVEKQIRRLVGFKLSQTDFEWLVDRVLCFGLGVISDVLEDERLTLSELLLEECPDLSCSPLAVIHISTPPEAPVLLLAGARHANDSSSTGGA